MEQAHQAQKGLFGIPTARGAQRSPDIRHFVDERPLSTFPGGAPALSFSCKAKPSNKPDRHALAKGADHDWFPDHRPADVRRTSRPGRSRQLLCPRLSGSGSTFVMLNGLPDNSHIYDDLIPHLASASRRTVAIDFLRFGASDKPAGAHYSSDQQFGDLERMDELIANVATGQCAPMTYKPYRAPAFATRDGLKRQSSSSGRLEHRFVRRRAQPRRHRRVELADCPTRHVVVR